MAEIKRKPLKIFIQGWLPYSDVADVDLTAFDDSHSINDICRWIESEDWTDEVLYYFGATRNES